MRDDDDRPQIYRDREGMWRWRVTGPAGEILDVSFGSFGRREDCETAWIEQQRFLESLEGSVQRRNKPKRRMLLEVLPEELTRQSPLDDLPPVKRQKISRQVLEVLNKRLERRIASLLADDERGELERLMEQHGDVAGYLRRVVSSIDVVTANVVAEFKRDLARWHKWSRAAPEIDSAPPEG